RHRPASQKRINADRLSHLWPHENPPDSIGAEHALVTDAAQPKSNVRKTLDTTSCSSARVGQGGGGAPLTVDRRPESALDQDQQLSGSEKWPAERRAALTSLRVQGHRHGNSNQPADQTDR